ncbi:LytR/AlgR family response regulator transcription factor [Carboxylicivirga sp. N1Y90]|uniref:LytR/AlgR family response regulator transcription factor n=1 Tax=Carboxylicivirga fragile TaxID=3417571 RepID=UPI003D336B20|nr:response regulator transcription factor [Marinilabiliaceae bacterium N1Y90]
MIKVLIVEDEMPSARKLKAFLAQIAPDFEVVDILDSVEQTVLYLNSNKVELIFLDIHLADGNSFSIFESTQVNTPIIFTTAFDQYAIQAFDQNSIGYLLKPIGIEKLAAAIEKFRSTLEQKAETNQTIDYNKLGQLLAQQKAPQHRERFMVHYRGKIKTVDISEVAYFYAENRAVFMVLNSGKTYDLSMTLEQLELELDPNIYYRANRKFIVSIKAIKEAVVYSKSKLKLVLSPESPSDVIISAEKHRNLKNGWLDKNCIS